VVPVGRGSNPQVRREIQIVVREMQFDWWLKNTRLSPSAKFIEPYTNRRTARGDLNQ
jgi:hypothetical protein